MLLSAFIFILLTGCGNDGNTGGDSPAVPAETEAQGFPASLYTAGTIVVEAAYEPGAEPFTGSMTEGVQTWLIFESNLDALFSGRSIEPDSVVPKDLSGMEQIPAQNRTTWTAADITALEKVVWDEEPSPGTVYIHILFLLGYLAENGASNPQVIGASISGKTVIVVFKDVVLSSGFTPALESYVEQATLIHEFGHVAGLVNNGIPMVTPHEDATHPRHCSNSGCVMYWLNEGAADLRSFAQQVIGSGSLVMLGPECLDDALGYQP